MDKFNFIEDHRALKFVRQFHSQRILRFLRQKQYKGLEDITDLQRSKSIVLSLNEVLGKKVA